MTTEAAGPSSSGGADDLIERIERFRWASATGYADAFRALHPEGRTAVRSFAGGIAAFIDDGSPINGLFAAGLTEPLTEQGLAEVESFFSGFASGFGAWVAPNRDIAPFVARGWAGPTTIRLFRLAAGPGRPADETIAIECVTDDPTTDPTAYGQLAARAFGAPTPTMARLFAAHFAMPGARLYRATVAGETAGVGRLVIHGDVADLGGGATLPGFRGRGVQAAMLRHRIEEAYRAGCSVIITSAEPAAASARNIVRAGFEPAFDYSVFRFPPGDG